MTVEGLVLGTCLRRSNHNFDSQRNKERSYQLHRISEGQPLASPENQFVESLENQSLRGRSPGRWDALQEGNLKGCPHVPNGKAG